MEFIDEDLGEDRCTRAFSKTVREFVDIRKWKAEVPSTKQVFDRFVKRPLYASKVDAKFTVERDIDVARCLQREEMSVLKDCYLVYLIINDMDKSPEEDEGLESEREFAYFEKMDKGADTLKGQRLREYLPKYSSIEYSFTGMFVKNLLWSERTA